MACQLRPWRAITICDQQPAAAPDLLGDFTAEAPWRKLVGDITEVRTWAAGCFWLPCSTAAPGK